MTHAHYRLTSDEFLAINSKLSDAQLRVYIYYKTLDPFGDRKVEVCTKAIAEILDIKQRTVQRALNKLCDLGLLIWEKGKSFVRRSCDRLGDLQIAKAIVGSPRRSQDRERQLELNLEADSTTSHTSSNLFKLDHDLEENFESIEDNNEISVDEALAEIRKALPDDESLDENGDLVDEDLQSHNEDEVEQGIEENLEPKTDLQSHNVGNTNGTGEGKPSRAAVEEFVLKTLNRTFTSVAQRAAYFSKFDFKSWKKWENQYKASLIPSGSTRDHVAEDPFRLITAIKSAMTAKDLDYALFRLEQLKAIAPELASQTQESLGIKS